MVGLTTMGVFFGGVAVGLCITPAVSIYLLGRDGTRWLAKSLKQYVEQELPPGPERDEQLDRLTKVENDMTALMEPKED